MSENLRLMDAATADALLNPSETSYIRDVLFEIFLFDATLPPPLCVKSSSIVPLLILFLVFFVNRS